MIIEGSKISKEISKDQLDDSQDKRYHNLFISKLLENGNYEVLELTKIVRKNRDTYKHMQIRNNNGNTIHLGKGAGGKIDDYLIYLKTLIELWWQDQL